MHLCSSVVGGAIGRGGVTRSKRNNPSSSCFHLNSYYARAGSILFILNLFSLAIRAAGFQSVLKKRGYGIVSDSSKCYGAGEP